MNNQTTFSTFANASVQLINESKLARQRSVAMTSDSAVVTASFNLTGKIGKEIRSQAISAGRIEIQRAVANGNFKPLAQFLALQFGESVYLRNQADFFALENLVQTKVDIAQSGKNLGMIVKKNKTTGEVTETMGARLIDALELQSFVGDLIGQTKAAIAEAAQKREQETTERAEIEIL